VETALGRTLLFNLQLSSGAGHRALYPNEVERLSDKYARILFDVSSELPPYMSEMGRALGLTIPAGARGFGCNADLTTLVQFLTVGTVPGNMK
jgi:hypothetical protein